MELSKRALAFLCRQYGAILRKNRVHNAMQGRLIPVVLAAMLVSTGFVTPLVVPCDTMASSTILLSSLEDIFNFENLQELDCTENEISTIATELVNTTVNSMTHANNALTSNTLALMGLTGNSELTSINPTSDTDETADHLAVAADDANKISANLAGFAAGYSAVIGGLPELEIPETLQEENRTYSMFAVTEGGLANSLPDLAEELTGGITGGGNSHLISSTSESGNTTYEGKFPNTNIYQLDSSGALITSPDDVVDNNSLTSDTNETADHLAVAAGETNTISANLAGFAIGDSAVIGSPNNNDQAAAKGDNTVVAGGENASNVVSPYGNLDKDAYESAYSNAYVAAYTYFEGYGGTHSAYQEAKAAISKTGADEATADKIATDAVAAAKAAYEEANDANAPVDTSNNDDQAAVTGSENSNLIEGPNTNNGGVQVIPLPVLEEDGVNFESQQLKFEGPYLFRDKIKTAPFNILSTESMYADATDSPTFSDMGTSRSYVAPSAPIWSAFISPFYGKSGQNNGDVDTNMLGLSMGITRFLNDQTLFGFNASVSRASSDSDGAETDATNYTIGVHALYKFNTSSYVRGQLTGMFGQSDYDFQSEILGQKLTAHTDTSSCGLYAQVAVGHSFMFGGEPRPEGGKNAPQHAIIPELALSYFYNHTDGYDAEYALAGMPTGLDFSMGSSDFDAVYADLTVRWTGTFDLGHSEKGAHLGALSPTARIGVRQAITDPEVTSRMEMLGLSTTNHSDLNETAFLCDLGLAWDLGEVELSLTYAGEFGNKEYSHMGTFKVEWGF